MSRLETRVWLSCVSHFKFSFVLCRNFNLPPRGMNQSTNMDHFIDPVSPVNQGSYGSQTETARTIRPNPSQSWAKSFHMTEMGRLGQNTSFVNVPKTKSAGSRHSTTPQQSASVEPDNPQSPFADSEDHPFPDHTCTADFTNDDFTNDEHSAEPMDPPLLEWMKNYRDTYLDEMLRHDGRSGITQCSACAADAAYKCKDCFGCQLLCQECFTTKHNLLPFHRALVSHVDFAMLACTEVLDRDGPATISKISL